MPSWLGAPELLIVLIIVILIFGVGRIANIGGELGKGISAFRKGLKGDEETKPEEQDKKDQQPPSQ
jgi:sec-independent protein translocase protein TatA